MVVGSQFKSDHGIPYFPKACKSFHHRTRNVSVQFGSSIARLLYLDRVTTSLWLACSMYPVISGNNKLTLKFASSTRKEAQIPKETAKMTTPLFLSCTRFRWNITQHSNTKWTSIHQDQRKFWQLIACRMPGSQNLLTSNIIFSLSSSDRDSSFGTGFSGTCIET